jgi:hypothetical protein
MNVPCGAIDDDRVAGLNQSGSVGDLTDGRNTQRTRYNRDM